MLNTGSFPHDFICKSIRKSVPAEQGCHLRENRGHSSMTPGDWLNIKISFSMGIPSEVENDLNVQADVISCEVLSGISNNVWSVKNVLKIINDWRNFDENMTDLVVRTVPADGLALLGATLSAGTVMIRFWFPIYTRPVLEALRLPFFKVGIPIQLLTKSFNIT